MRLKKKSKGQKKESEVNVVKRKSLGIGRTEKMYGLQQRSECSIHKSQLQYL